MVNFITIGYGGRDNNLISALKEVNHPHPIGVGMSREGYGQQVDKEA